MTLLACPGLTSLCSLVHTPRDCWAAPDSWAVPSYTAKRAQDVIFPSGVPSSFLMWFHSNDSCSRHYALSDSLLPFTILLMTVVHHMSLSGAIRAFFVPSAGWSLTLESSHGWDVQGCSALAHQTGISIPLFSHPHVRKLTLSPLSALTDKDSLLSDPLGSVCCPFCWWDL